MFGVQLQGIAFSENISIYFLAYILVPVLFCEGIQKAVKGKDILTFDVSNILKSIGILGIVLNHISLLMNPIGLMKPFHLVGMLGVSLFFFLSAYGLVQSVLKTGLCDFWAKRLKKVYFPFVCVNAISLLVMTYYGVSLTVQDIVLFLLGAKLFDTTMWFVPMIFFWYVAFFLFVRYSKSLQKVPYWLAIAAILFWYIARTAGFGEWWYNTVAAFPLGAFVGVNKSYFLRWGEAFRQYRWACIVLLFTAMCMLVCLAGGYVLGRSFAGAGVRTIGMIFFLALSMMMVVLIQLRSKALIFVSTFSYEIYLIHMKVLNIYFGNIKGDNIFIFFVLLIIIGYAVHLITCKAQKALFDWRVK